MALVMVKLGDRSTQDFFSILNNILIFLINIYSNKNVAY